MLIDELTITNTTKIVYLIMDGLGGLPLTPEGKTELETAKTPNMDALLKKSVCGFHNPIGTGITAGSAPGHFALFGYDPTIYQIGRGVVAATGVGFPLKTGDLAARINFCTVDDHGNVTDRRAGRIKTEINATLCEKLSSVKIAGVEIFVKPVKDHRAVVIFRGSGLDPELEDTDPQKEGVLPLECKPIKPVAQKSADIVNNFIKQAKEILKNEKPANMVLMRGFASLSHIPSMEERFKLKAACLAVYPDYKGISNLVGMTVLGDFDNLQQQIDKLKAEWAKYDFFFIHVKGTDSSGEDGNFDKKVQWVEDTDKYLPQILGLNPDVLVITGDHSTPSLLKSHSWHPVPLMIYSKCCRPDGVEKFGERPCKSGSLGTIRCDEVINLALAYSLRTTKFGA